MLYELFNWLEQSFALPGATAMAFISTRTGLAAVTSLLISLFIGKRIIEWLQSMQLGEVIRDDIGLNHINKQGTPNNGWRNYLVVYANPISFVCSNRQYLRLAYLFCHVNTRIGWVYR